MKIHEYQAKELLRRFDVKVPRGSVARTVAEAEAAAKELGLPVVIKAQIHAGGRGKGGGVKLARTAEDVTSLAKSILGMNLVTHQTGRPEGSDAAHRRGPEDQTRILSGHRAGSRRLAARLYGFLGWRDGHRRGCRAHAGKDPEGIH
jgi:ATP-grasp domain